MLENKMCFIIAAISCNKDVLGSLRGCVLLFEWKSYDKWNCAIACISVCLNVMYYNEHSLSNQQTERKVKECIGFERWFLMQVTRVQFYWPIDERSNVDWSIHEWRYFNNRLSTHCQLRSIRALRFSNNLSFSGI